GGLEGPRRRLVHADLSLEAPDDVFGGDLAPIVEGRALAELELPRLAVLARGVALRQPRLELGRIALVAIEVVVDVELDERRRHVVERVRVEVRGQVVTPHEGAL